MHFESNTAAKARKVPGKLGWIPRQHFEPVSATVKFNKEKNAYPSWL